MSNIIKVSSVEIPELDLFVGNKEVHLLRYFEPEPGLFIAETRNVIEIALNQGFEPYCLVCTEKMLDDPLLDRIGDAPIYVVEATAAQKHFGYVLTGGISAAMRRKKAVNENGTSGNTYIPAACRDILEKAKRIVALEDVENPTNIGAILRSAAALGLDAVILSPACSDPFYRRAMRVSVGTSLLVPWTYLCSSEEEWKEKGIAILQSAGFTCMAMALRKDNHDLDDPVLKQADKLAIVMGNEGNGLCDETINACDYVVKIPMMNGVDSLNVSVAASLAMWELCR